LFIINDLRVLFLKSRHRNNNIANRTAPQHNPILTLNSKVRESADGNASGKNPTLRRNDRTNERIPAQNATAAKIKNPFRCPTAAARGQRIAATPLDTANAGQTRGI